MDEAWQWEPSLLEVRRSLEHAFGEALARRLKPVRSAVDVPAALRDVIAPASGPSRRAATIPWPRIGGIREEDTPSLPIWAFAPEKVSLPPEARRRRGGSG